MRTLQVVMVDGHLPSKLGTLCYEGDKLSAAIEIIGAKSDFSYKLDTQNVVTGEKNVLDLDNRNGTLYSVINVAIPSGRYKVQLRTVGDVVEHSSIGEMLVEYSIEALSSFDPNVPTELEQLEQRVTTLRNEASDFASDAQSFADSARDEADSAAESARQAAEYAEQAAVDMESRVAKSGDTMTGTLVAPSVKIANPPTADEDAVTKRYADDQHAAIQEFLDAIIPEQASADNQLADKEFVNSSVATNTANYISDNGQPFASVEALEAYTGTLTNNDYAFVVGTDSAGNTIYTRYKWSASSNAWAEEFVLNNSSFTAVQWDAINSGITSLLVSAFTSHIANDAIHVTTSQKSAWSAKQDAISDLATIRSNANLGATAYRKPVDGIPESDLSEGVQSKLNMEWAVIDDTTVGSDAWSSKQTVDALCKPITASGTLVQCYPVTGYPMTVNKAAVAMGKNLFCANDINGDGASFERRITNGNHYRFKALSSVTTSYLANSAMAEQFKNRLLPAGTYLFTAANYTGKSIAGRTLSIELTPVGGGAVVNMANGTPITINQPCTMGQIRLQPGPDFVVGNTLEFDIMVEVGTSFSGFEKGVYHDSVDGVLTAVQGVNNIFAADGSKVTVTGREDLQHQLDTLNNAILSLGGNV